MAKNKKKFYVVWDGVTPGVYETWADCQLQIKGYPGAKYKSYGTKDEAELAYAGNYSDQIVRKGQTAKSLIDYSEIIEKNSICVDAACSGNPGDMEYRGVESFSKDEIFRMGPFTRGTNNVGEFLALVHGLAYCQKIGREDIVIYSDSKIAMNWVKIKTVKTKLQRRADNQKLFHLIDRGVVWLKNNTYKNEIKKWDTKNWGEIPADFGRK